MSNRHAPETAEERATRVGIRVLIGVEAGRRATDLFPEVLPELPPSERGEVVETVYAVLRDQRRLEAAVNAIATAPVRARDRARAWYLAHLVRRGALSPEAAQDNLQGLDFARLPSAYEAVLHGLGFDARLALEHNLPEWLVVALLADQRPVEGEALIRALSEAPPFTIRANRLKGDRQSLAEQLAAHGVPTTSTRWSPDGLNLDRRRDVYGYTEFQAGAFEVQDEGSQLIALLVAPPPKGLVIDVCAGAGGKTLALGALLKGQGRLLACDVPSAEKRLEELGRRARRAGLSNLQVVITPAEGAWPEPLARLEHKADRVLVDAPCSGSGVLRRNPEARLSLTAEKVERLALLQLRILERALSLVHDKGRLIYATCSLLRAENDGVVERFLAAHPELERVPAKEILGKELAQGIGDGEVLRLLPHRHGTDGFYAAVLRYRRTQPDGTLGPRGR